MSATAAPARASPAARLSDLARAAAGPVACAAVLIGLLSGWVATGGTGNIIAGADPDQPGRCPDARLPRRNGRPIRPAGTFLTIVNRTATADELIAVRSPVAKHIMLLRRTGPEDPGTVAGALTIPAKSSITLTPFGDDVVLRDPVRYESDSTVPLTLTFRHAGTVTVSADVTAPGTP